MRVFLNAFGLGCGIVTVVFVARGDSPAIALLVVPLMCFGLFQTNYEKVIVDLRSRSLTIVHGLARHEIPFEELVEVGFPLWGVVSVVVETPRRRWWGLRTRRMVMGISGTKANQRRVKELAGLIGIPVVSPLPAARWNPGEPLPDE